MKKDCFYKLFCCFITSIFLYFGIYFKMASRLLLSSKYLHLKMIYENPRGIKNRFKNNADKWVESMRHPHVKTYHQLFVNRETQEHYVEIKLTEEEENSMEKIKRSYRPGKAAIVDYFKLHRATRPDDLDLSRDISDMTIKKFIEEGRKNFSDLHRLVVYGFAFIVLHIILYFIFVHGKELPKNERVKVLNAEILESYHFESEETKIKKIIERIELINGQYERQLASTTQK